MTQYSMAHNTSDFLSGKPDMRTGLFAKKLEIGKLKGNYQNGPSFKLQLSFNPQQDFMNFLTPFGSGWGIAVSAFLRSSNFGDGHLVLPSGKSYYITELHDGAVTMDGYSLKDIQITWDNSTETLTVVEKTGTVHYYRALPGDQSSGNLYLYQTTSDNGLSLYFFYDNSQFSSPDGSMQVCLSCITDDTGAELVNIDYSGAAGTGSIISLEPDSNIPRQFSFLQESNTLATIYGPENYEAHLSYYYNNGDGGVPMFLLSGVSDSFGLYEKVTYSTPSTGGITLPGGSLIQTTVQQYLCAGDLSVTDGSTDYIATYSFTADANQYNYLGNPVIVNADERVDSLLHYTGSFNYSSMMCEKVTMPSAKDVQQTIIVKKITTSTYNKFHSLIEKKITYISDDEPDYYNEGNTFTETFTYQATDGDITQQVSTYALPLSHSQTWTDGSNYTTQNEVFSWDDFANQLSRVTKSGMSIERTYYSAAGDTGCPVEPYGFVRHLKTKITTPGAPSSNSPSLPVAPVRQFDYAYDSCQGYNGSVCIRRTHATLSEDAGSTWVQKKTWEWDSTLLQAIRLTVSTVTYPSSPTNLTTMTSLEYSLQDNNATIRTIMTKSGYDGLQCKKRIDHNSVTGKMIATADITVSEADPVVTMNYTYDALGRRLSEVACKGSQFESSQLYSYIPSSFNLLKEQPNKPNLTSEYVPTHNLIVTSTNQHGLKYQTTKDSSGRTLAQLVQDIDQVVSSDNEKYWKISKTKYDGLGNKITSTSYDWLPDANDNTPSIMAVTTYRYDPWGEQYQMLAADGHTETSQHDPISHTIYSSLTATDGKEIQKQRDTLDVNGNILKTERLNADSSVYSVETNDYDGFGRKIQSIDALNQITITTFDAFDRPIIISRPDGSLIKMTWAQHSDDSLMASVTVQEHASDTSDKYTYGVRKFDGLDRVKNMTIGGCQSIFYYDPDNNSATKPKAFLTPARNIIYYTYQQELHEAVLSVTSDAHGEEAALTYTYDPTTGDMLTSDSDMSDDDYVHHVLKYTPSGKLKTDTLTYQFKRGAQVSSIQSMTYSLTGKPLTTTDAGGLIHVISYDPIGRKYGYTLTQNSLDPAATLSSVQYNYDPAGRQYQTITTDNISGNTQSTTLEWHDFGKEWSRTIEISGTVNSIQKQELTYYLNDQIETRNTTRDGQTLRIESYSYTPLNQLEYYICTGSYPDSPDGYQLTKQYYKIDFIGNISLVISYLLDKDEKMIVNTAIYTPDSPDRSRLKSITNDIITGWDTTLTYDDDGNMTTDDQHRVLVYNSRNQLMSVFDAQQHPLGFLRYDANGLQIAEKKESDRDVTTLYYQSSQTLMNEMQGTISSTYIDTLSCTFRNNDEKYSVALLGSDQQNSIIQVSDVNEISWRVYDPYGYSKE